MNTVGTLEVLTSSPTLTRERELLLALLLLIFRRCDVFVIMVQIKRSDGFQIQYLLRCKQKALISSYF